MGSGKSTLGPILANTLGYDFVDLDAFIEARAGMPVPEIFRTMGEGSFRELERTAVHEMGTRTATVIALGGGALAHEDNLQFVRTHGVLVYLQISPQEAYRRMRNKMNRPMLRDEAGEQLSDEALQARIKGLMELRERYYRQADVIVQTGRSSIGATVDELVRKLRTHLND